MPATDTDFLKKRLVQKALQTPPPQKVEKNATEKASDFLENITADEPGVSKRAQRLHKRAQQLDADDKEKAAREAEAAEAEEAAIAEEKRKKALAQRNSAAQLGQRIDRLAVNAGGAVGPLADKVGSLPTVGGIGILLILLAVLLFAVVRVNPQGDTRLKQLWYMLNGRATIKGRQHVVTTGPGGGVAQTLPDGTIIASGTGPGGVQGVGAGTTFGAGVAPTTSGPYVPTRDPGLGQF